MLKNYYQIGQRLSLSIVYFVAVGINAQQFLIGSYTNTSSEGVYLLTLQDNPLKLINHGAVAKTDNPGYLALSKDQRQLYSIAKKNNNSVVHFQWQKDRQEFLLKQQLEIPGKGVCHISMNPQQTHLATASYGSGDVNVLSINENDYSIAQESNFKNIGKSKTKRQKSAHMHYSAWDKLGKFLYTIDLGTDEIKVFDTSNENLSPIHVIKVGAGDGPRHLVFHPNKPVVYLLNELSNTVIVYKQNITTGALFFKQRVSALPESFKSGNSASAIKISKDGRFVYAGIRGINAISVFSVTENNDLKFIQSASAIGNWPRDLTISADQKYLLVANQKSNTVNVLKRDIETGLLSPTSFNAEVFSASFVGNFNPTH